MTQGCSTGEVCMNYDTPLTLPSRPMTAADRNIPEYVCSSHAWLQGQFAAGNTRKGGVSRERSLCHENCKYYHLDLLRLLGSKYFQKYEEFSLPYSIWKTSDTIFLFYLWIYIDVFTWFLFIFSDCLLVQMMYWDLVGYDVQNNNPEHDTFYQSLTNMKTHKSLSIICLFFCTYHMKTYLSNNIITHFIKYIVICLDVHLRKCWYTY